MNISPNNISGNCSIKCSYAINYSKSKSTATNYGTSINLTYEASNIPPVSYNGIKYNVVEIVIFSSSSQLYNGSNSDGEMIILHSAVSGGPMLFVIIPISARGVASNASSILQNIVSAVSTNAPSQGNNTTQGINEFTLNDVIPMKQFYTYSPNGMMDVISFGIGDAIYISSDTLNKLQQCITPTAEAFPSAELFINRDGPSTGDFGGSDIYIDCQPTGSSEETENVVNIKAPINNDISTNILAFLLNPVVMLILSSIIFVIVILIIYKGLKYISGDTGSPPNATSGGKLK
jgi:hypothetical protein